MCGCAPLAILLELSIELSVKGCCTGMKRTSVHVTIGILAISSHSFLLNNELKLNDFSLFLNILNSQLDLVVYVDNRAIFF